MIQTAMFAEAPVDRFHVRTVDAPAKDPLAGSEVITECKLCSWKFTSQVSPGGDVQRTVRSHKRQLQDELRVKGQLICYCSPDSLQKIVEEREHVRAQNSLEGRALKLLQRSEQYYLEERKKIQQKVDLRNQKPPTREEETPRRSKRKSPPLTVDALVRTLLDDPLGYFDDYTPDEDEL